MSKLVIHTDGGARGNPGPAAIGVVVKKDGTVVFEKGLCIGTKTNNEAEYLAFLDSVSWLHTQTQEQQVSEVEWKLDSMLVVEQLNKKWKIKEARLATFAQEIWSKLSALKIKYTISHIRREHNSEADALVNQALDAA
jgi:ribonuclease HI